MATDYRALHNQYAQGMAQPGTVQPNSQPGFNFLQGWSASPTAGFLPPKQPTQAPIQYGTPTQGGWIGGADGQPVGGNAGQSWMVNGQDPRAMMYDGIKGNYIAWRDGQSTGAGDPRGLRNNGIAGDYASWRDAYNPSNPNPAIGSSVRQGGNMQANFGMQQPNQLMPGFGATPMPKPQPNFGDPMPKPIPNFGIPMPKPIVGGIQYDEYGKPIRNDQLNPGRDPNIWGGP